MNLAQMYCLMYECKEYNAFQAVNTLVNDINTTENFLAIGLFDEDKLVGFTAGHKLRDGVFYFSGIYLSLKNSDWTQKIIDFSFAHIKELGYTAWELDATNDNISSIMRKYGATVKSTKFYKELQ